MLFTFIIWGVHCDQSESWNILGKKKKEFRFLSARASLKTSRVRYFFLGGAMIFAMSVFSPRTVAAVPADGRVFCQSSGVPHG